MKKIGIIWILVGVLSFSVLGQKRKDAVAAVTVSYFLPVISCQVEVVMEQTDLIPGPLAAYAYQQLGESRAIKARGEEWRIRSLKMKTVPLPDKERNFKFTAAGDYSTIAFQLTPEAFLAGVGAQINTVNELQQLNYQVPESGDPSILYYRFGIESTLKEELDSNFMEMEVEGEMRKVWDPIIRYVLKSPEDYVQEATDEIFAIREKRMQLLSGEKGAGAATKEALEELRELEEQYLSLFLGKRVTREVVKTVSFIPEQANQTMTLFRFSEKEGITAKNNVNAQPYLIEIGDVIIPEDPHADQMGAGITYCIPALTQLRLLKGKEVLMEDRIIIPQLGILKEFPAEVISKSGVSIEFYPQYGSIKSITKSR